MKAKGYAAAAIAAIFYGTNPLGTLYLYQGGINPASVLIYRYTFATLMFLLCMAVKRESLSIKWGTGIRLAILGTLMSMSSATLYISFQYMDAGVASTILFSYPIMVAVLMVIFYHEKVTWTTTISIAMAITGISLLYRGGHGATLSTIGVSLVILSSLLYAFYIIGVNQTHTKMPATKFTFWIVLFGLIALLIFTAFTGEHIQPLQGIKEFASALQLALLPTVLSLFFINIAIEHIGSTPTAIMGALEPVTAVCIGVCVFGEHFTLRLGIGIVLILSAVIILMSAKGKAEDNHSNNMPSSSQA